ncbi:glycerophosphodiester phosphodiesterase [Anaerobacillus alkalidiazotrophicus]|uniref:Glycerophosphodiester phosphodiesterase n=1 Tax=Anaerobacillus alkalidiazotrophicus TaxID=472963 RepID=A0A1S2MCF4_9BACI|nr:glycerophosphodiester phosphodiesterase [Anaerobacillus alkalidiazotrophicus]
MNIFKALTLCFIFLASLFSIKMSTLPKAANRHVTIAHRGGAGYAPENTMAAFKKAVEMKCDYLELDVQMSKEGEFVVIHDQTVNRTTNVNTRRSIYVADLTVAQIKQLDAGSYYGTEFCGERIPTLKEVLDEFSRKIGIIIEVKEPELYPEIEEKLAAILIGRQLDQSQNSNIIIQSFNFHFVKKIRELLPEVTTAVIISKRRYLTDDYLKEFTSYADYVNTSRRLVTKQLVERIHSHHMKMMSWTVRSKSQITPLMKAGVDGIITDYPDYVG